MQTLSSDDPEINQHFVHDVMSIDAVDESGFLASVEINLFPRWRQAHGIPTFSQMVEIALDCGVTFAFPEGSDRYQPGRYSLALNTADLAILQDPHRATFMSMSGIVVEHPHCGGRA